MPSVAPASACSAATRRAASTLARTAPMVVRTLETAIFTRRIEALIPYDAAVRPGLFMCATLATMVACRGGKRSAAVAEEPQAEVKAEACTGSQTPRAGLEIERLEG